uniref:Uncharacterized protein n=1 Tax=Panagrolaimus sp. ES5 TaxID=591445 RepID=A0AC34FUG6_9BILA
MDIKKCKKVLEYDDYHTALIEGNYVCPGCERKLFEHLSSEYKIIKHYNDCFFGAKHFDEEKVVPVENKEIVKLEQKNHVAPLQEMGGPSEDELFNTKLGNNEVFKQRKLETGLKFDPTKLRAGQSVCVVVNGKPRQGRIYQVNYTRDPIRKLRSFSVGVGKERRVFLPGDILRARDCIVPFMKPM